MKNIQIICRKIHITLKYLLFVIYVKCQAIRSSFVLSFTMSREHCWANHAVFNQARLSAGKNIKLIYLLYSSSTENDGCSFCIFLWSQERHRHKCIVSSFETKMSKWKDMVYGHYSLIVKESYERKTCYLAFVSFVIVVSLCGILRFILSYYIHITYKIYNIFNEVWWIITYLRLVIMSNQ